jgi:putative oxidoreductase
VGYGFMEHGFAKLSREPDAFATILQAMGVPDPHLMARLTILIELLGGLAVILGAFVAIVSLPMVAVLLVAMFKVHLQYGFSSIKLLAVTASGARFGPVGYEVNLLYIACLAALILGGSGPSAIDSFIGHAVSDRLERWKFTARQDDQAERALEIQSCVPRIAPFATRSKNGPLLESKPTAMRRLLEIDDRRLAARRLSC